MIRSEFRSALRRCPTEEEAGSGASPPPVGQLKSLIAQRMQRAQELLEEMRLQVRLTAAARRVKPQRFQTKRPSDPLLFAGAAEGQG